MDKKLVSNVPKCVCSLCNTQKCHMMGGVWCCLKEQCCDNAV